MSVKYTPQHKLSKIQTVMHEKTSKIQMQEDFNSQDQYVSKILQEVEEDFFQINYKVKKQIGSFKSKVQFSACLYDEERIHTKFTKMVAFVGYFFNPS